MRRVDEREGEQEQAGDARRYRRLLAAREATRMAVGAEDRESRDPRRADALHERQRREPERRPLLCVVAVEEQSSLVRGELLEPLRACPRRLRVGAVSPEIALEMLYPADPETNARVRLRE